MDQNQLIKLLEEMPINNVLMVKIGENESALEILRRSKSKLTMQDIRDHNNYANGYNEGYKAAMAQIRQWRNEQYLKLKNLV